MINHVVYAKKFTLPSQTANALQSVNMAYAFAEQGVKTTLFPGFKGDKTTQRHELENRYTLHPTPALNLVPLAGGHKGVYGLTFRARLAAAWFRADKGTVFYTRDIKEGLMLARLKRSFPFSRPIFFEMHEILAQQNAKLGTGKEPRYKQMETELLAQVDGIISISELLSRDIEKFYAPTASIFTSPMGYNEHLYRPMPNVDLSGDITIAYVGSLYKGKGVHNLLAAMSHLPDKFHLRIIGGSPQKELKTLKEAAAKYNGRVELTGHLAPRDLPDHLSSCQIFVIPQCTEVEFFSPIKLYEALGMTLPIITTPIPTIAAAVTHKKDVYIASGTAPESLAAAIKDLAENPTLAHSLQHNAREQAQQLTWQQRAGQCLKFMNTLVTT